MGGGGEGSILPETCPPPRAGFTARPWPSPYRIQTNTLPVGLGGQQLENTVVPLIAESKWEPPRAHPGVAFI